MDNHGEILIYQTEDGLTKINVNMQDETVWLSLEQMANLFERDKSIVSKHIKNVFEDGELVRNSVVAKFATTASDGKTYQVDYYNLDVIISVGYRVKSQRGVQFRIWVSGYLDFAERQAERKIPMTMEDWAKHLDGILASTGENLFTGSGTTSHSQAMEKPKLNIKNI